MSVSDLFEELTRVVQGLNPPMTLRFNPPATREAIASLEGELGVTLPVPLRDILACADGQIFPGDQYPDPLFPSIRLRSGDLGRTSASWLIGTDDILDLWRIDRERFEDLKDDGPFEVIGPTSYHDGLLSFSRSEDANNLCLDLRPLDGGTVGQVVMLNTQPFQVVVLASSLDAFLSDLIDGYRSGRFHPVPHSICCEWREE